MATPIFCCGAECGASGAGSHFTTLTNATFSTSTVRSGARSLRLNGTAVSIVANGGFALSGTTAAWRYYLNVTTNPINSAVVGVVAVRTGLTHSMGLAFKSSDSKYYAGYSDTGPSTNWGATGVTLTAGWHRIDCLVNVTSNPWTIDVAVDGTALGQRQIATAGSSLIAWDIGNRHTTNTTDYYVDDIVMSQTAADYPLGGGYVNHFVPTSDGTHNIAGTADFRRTLTATDILNATTTAYQLVDDVPLESGASVDWINMLAPVNATDYVECIFGPAPGISTPTVAPRAVEVIAGIHQAATTTGNMEIRLNDNGTMGTVYTATAVAGVTSVAYKRAHFADPPSAATAWVIGGGGNGDFTDLRVRFGSPAVLDVVPDQYFDCIMLEAEFETEDALMPTPDHFNHAVHRASRW